MVQLLPWPPEIRRMKFDVCTERERGAKLIVVSYMHVFVIIIFLTLYSSLQH